MRPVFWVLINQSNPYGNLVAAVTDDCEIARLWLVNHPDCFVEEVALNRATSLVDARGRFFKLARKQNPEFIK